MAKVKRKVQLALEARRADFRAMNNNETSLRGAGLYRHEPGSQNRKKGYGKGNNRR